MIWTHASPTKRSKVVKEECERSSIEEVLDDLSGDFGKLWKSLGLKSTKRKHWGDTGWLSAISGWEGKIISNVDGLVWGREISNIKWVVESITGSWKGQTSEKILLVVTFRCSWYITKSVFIIWNIFTYFLNFKVCLTNTIPTLQPNILPETERQSICSLCDALSTRTGIWSLPFLHRRTARESQRIFLAELVPFCQ